MCVCGDTCCNYGHQPAWGGQVVVRRPQSLPAAGDVGRSRDFSDDLLSQGRQVMGLGAFALYCLGCLANHGPLPAFARTSETSGWLADTSYDVERQSRQS